MPLVLRTPASTAREAREPVRGELSVPAPQSLLPESDGSRREEDPWQGPAAQVLGLSDSARKVLSLCRTSLSIRSGRKRSSKRWWSTITRIEAGTSTALRNGSPSTRRTWTRASSLNKGSGIRTHWHSSLWSWRPWCCPHLDLLFTCQNRCLANFYRTPCSPPLAVPCRRCTHRSKQKPSSRRRWSAVHVRRSLGPSTRSSTRALDAKE